MQKTIKKVLGCLNDCKLDSKKILGELIETILFKEQALLIDHSGNAYLLTTDSERNGLLLTDLISVLKELEENHLIYVSDNKTREDLCLFYDKKSKCETTQFVGQYDLGNGQTLVMKDGVVFIENNGKKVLEGALISEILATEIVRYLTSIVYPTEGLKEYVKRGYQTEERRLSKRANTISVVSIVIAIMIAALSPFLTVWWSNTHGNTAIIDSQFNRLIDTIDSIKYHEMDTVSLDINKGKK